MMPTARELINRLAALEPLISYETLLEHVFDSGNMNALCISALSILFVCSCVKMLMNMMNEKIDPGQLIVLIMQIIVVVSFFCIPAVYHQVNKPFFSVSESFLTEVTGSGLTKFQVTMREYLYTVQATSPGTVNQSFLSAKPVEFLFIVSNMIMLMVIYLVLSFGPVFLVFAMMLGPIALAFSPVLPQAARRWAMFYIGAVFWSLIVGVALSVSADVSVVRAASGSLGNNNYLLALPMVMCATMFLISVPALTAAVFGVQLFGLLSDVFSAVSLITGQILFWLKLKSVKGMARMYHSRLSG